MRPSIDFSFPVSFPELGDGDMALRDAANWIVSWIRLCSRFVPSPAAVFDIDSTLLVGKERIEEVVAVFEECKKIGVSCFLVTARGEEGREGTTRLLFDLGLTGYSGLYMMDHSRFPISLTGMSESKRRARKEVEETHTIVANLGDMWSDHLLFPLHDNGLKQLVKTRDASIIAFFSGNCACLKLPH